MLTSCKSTRMKTSGFDPAHVESDIDGTQADPIVIDAHGTQDDPITISDDDDPDRAHVHHAMILRGMPLHQHNRFLQLAAANISPVNFRYVIAPNRLRELAKKYTNRSRYAIVVGLIRRPTWDVEDTYPEYICIAALEGGKALKIRVKMYSVEGQSLEPWPGGGQNYVTLESIKERGYLFPPFCNDFSKDRLRNYLKQMAEIDGMPRVRETVSTISNA